MLSDELYKSITNWIDAHAPFISYMYIRSLVKSAMDNTLVQEYPECPYSARQILLWANQNDKDSFLFTPGGQAIQGETVSDWFDGTPVINPLTQLKNSDEDIRGLAGNVDKFVLDRVENTWNATTDGISSVWNSTENLMKKGAIALAIGGVAYLFLEPLAKELAKKITKGGK